MGLSVALSQDDDVDGAKETVPPKGVSTGSTHSVSVNGALEVALGKNKTQARRALLRAQANKQKNAGPALPQIGRRKDGIKFSFDEKPVRPRKCVRRRRQENA
jgi:hypothetical protein